MATTDAHVYLHNSTWGKPREPTCANHSASASVRRPSASVLFTSTVLPGAREGGRDAGSTKNCYEAP